mmetsp:Transcript_8164/g.15809  ORF Transcript_8164/g.15809 Transcript_8164/m.15809 type:complete len:260 (-) Transcript_8164:732-1511(-)|eukprot:scaffold3233_cov178-Amphora_coffeaeformis.AAC.4
MNIKPTRALRALAFVGFYTSIYLLTRIFSSFDENVLFLTEEQRHSRYRHFSCREHTLRTMVQVMLPLIMIMMLGLREIVKKEFSDECYIVMYLHCLVWGFLLAIMGIFTTTLQSGSIQAWQRWPSLFALSSAIFLFLACVSASKYLDEDEVSNESVMLREKIPYLLSLSVLFGMLAALMHKWGFFVLYKSGTPSSSTDEADRYEEVSHGSLPTAIDVAQGSDNATLEEPTRSNALRFPFSIPAMIAYAIGISCLLFVGR